MLLTACTFEGGVKQVISYHLRLKMKIKNKIGILSSNIKKT